MADAPDPYRGAFRWAVWRIRHGSASGFVGSGFGLTFVALLVGPLFPLPKRPSIIQYIIRAGITVVTVCVCALVLFLFVFAVTASYEQRNELRRQARASSGGGGGGSAGRSASGGGGPGPTIDLTQAVTQIQSGGSRVVPPGFHDENGLLVPDEDASVAPPRSGQQDGGGGD